MILHRLTLPTSFSRLMSNYSPLCVFQPLTVLFTALQTSHVSLLHKTFTDEGNPLNWLATPVHPSNLRSDSAPWQKPLSPNTKALLLYMHIAPVPFPSWNLSRFIIIHGLVWLFDSLFIQLQALQQGRDYICILSWKSLISSTIPDTFVGA